MDLEGVEVTVAMKQSVTPAQAEGRDQTINRFTNSDALHAQPAVVLCGSYGQSFATSLENVELSKLFPDAFEICVAARTLQDLTQNQVGKPETLAIEFAIKPGRLTIHRARKIIDPDSGVDDHHTPLISYTALP